MDTVTLRLLPEPAGTMRTNILSGIAEHYVGEPVAVKVADINSVGAAEYPDGGRQITLHPRLHPESLPYVLAHEIAHHIHGHMQTPAARRAGDNYLWGDTGRMKVAAARGEYAALVALARDNQVEQEAHEWAVQHEGEVKLKIDIGNIIDDAVKAALERTYGT